jgi:DnaJ-class molecular chaperone
MNSKVFNPEKIGMKGCPHCNSYGRKYGSVCSRCGGFGYIKKDGRKFSVSPSISKTPLTHSLPSAGRGDIEIS